MHKAYDELRLAISGLAVSAQRRDMQDMLRRVEEQARDAGYKAGWKARGKGEWANGYRAGHASSPERDEVALRILCGLAANSGTSVHYKALAPLLAEAAFAIADAFLAHADPCPHDQPKDSDA